MSNSGSAPELAEKGDAGNGWLDVIAHDCILADRMAQE